MRVILFFILTICASFEANTNDSLGIWVIERSSSLAIDGSSNVNEFTCSINEYLQADTLWNSVDAGRRKMTFRKSRLNVEIRRFDCIHKYITADFRKMLLADKYPYLSIEFISLDELKTGGMVRGLVDIELAGKKKRMEILYACALNGPKNLTLKGEKIMKFTDFELEPPRKLGGLIRINEDIKVHFNLNFKKLN